MARPIMRDANGRWSLIQVADAAGLTHRRARDLVEAGYLDGSDLRANDILYARVAAAIIDAVRPAGQSRAASAQTITARNHQALVFARDVAAAHSPNTDAMLLLTSTGVTLHKKVLALAAALEETTEPTLVVPVGRWDNEVRDLITSLSREDGAA